MRAKQQLMKKRAWYLWLLAAIWVLIGAAYTIWQPGIFSKPAAQTTPAYQTASVRRGNLSNTVTGTGTLTASKTADLSFPVTGKVAVLNVQVSDSIKAGQVLAALDNLEQLKLSVDNSQLALQTAQQTMESYISGADTNLAQAQLSLASAEKAYFTAKQNVHQKGDPRCDPSLTEQYYSAYLDAQKQVQKWEPYLYDHKGGYGTDYLLQTLNPLWRKQNLAFINFTYCQGYTDPEIAASQANLQTAKANLDSAQTNYQKLTVTNGLDPITVAIDQAAVKSSQSQLAKAQNNLAGAALVSPIDGTVTVISGSIGQVSGTSTFISVADLNNPMVVMSMDETDLSNFSVGCTAQVRFNSIPGKTFQGTVTQIQPVLTSTKNVTVAQGTVALKDISQTIGKTLPLGTDASVDVTCSQANNVLEVPLQALHDVSGQPAFVFILNSQEKPEKRTVTVGLKTSAFAEIRSGLSEGDRVITSQMKTQ